MKIIKRGIRKLFVLSEFFSIYTFGKLFGITYIVSYLRNPNPKITIKILRSFGASIGDNTIIKRSLFLDNVEEDENSAGDFRYLIIGKNCYIGDCVYFDLSNIIEIEDNVVISGQVSFITHSDCNRSKFLAENFPRKCEPLRIERGAWVGFKATILHGITIGNQTVIASNSLLRKNAGPKAFYAGVPAKRIRELVK